VAERDWGRRLLLDAVGLRLEGIARAFYEQRGEIDERCGPLELTFAGGRVLHLTTATNGESLWVREGLWFDPVADPEAGIPADRAAEHGRWVHVDLTGRCGYVGTIGERLEAPRWLANDHGSVAGVEMRFGAETLVFVSWGDDEHVMAGGAAVVPAEWGMRVIPSPEPSMEAR